MSAVRVAIEGGLGRITIDRPPVNVLTTSMMLELAAALRRVSEDQGVRVVRLDAVGKAFCAGVDVGDHVGDKLTAMMDALRELFAAFDAVAPPIVAVVQGAALGGGLELLLGCDLIVSSETATFGQPEIKLGVFAPPATVLMPRLIGERFAAHVLLTGDTLDAAEARRIGLVHEVFPAAGLEAGATARIAKLLAGSGAALRIAKRAIRIARGDGTREAHARLHDLYLGALMSTEDAHEGLRAFMEKRPPAWKHR
jgi:cyclohexa-1,5-dienecarbonyl-CoA hydratase